MSGPRTLVIDCSTEAASVALFDGQSLIAGEWHRLGRGHAEALVPMIAALPGKGRAERIAVALGPGSFTGIRVGIAAARALALAWDASLTGFATPALIAAQARHEAGAVAVSVAMTGGHGEWFLAEFAADGTALGDPVSLSPDEAIAAARAATVAGDRAEARVAARGHGTAITPWPDARGWPLLGEAALRHEVTPLYVRLPDARLPGEPARGTAA